MPAKLTLAMHSNNTPQESSTKPQDSVASSSNASPKKFFRAFHSSPFKSSKSKEIQPKHPESRELQKAHARTQSYDHPPSTAQGDQNNWISMIRPIPQGAQGDVPITLPEKYSNRHTIAISPSMNLQSFQQPHVNDQRYHQNRNSPQFAAQDLSRGNVIDSKQNAPPAPPGYHNQHNQGIPYNQQIQPSQHQNQRMRGLFEQQVHGGQYQVGPQTYPQGSPQYLPQPQSQGFRQQQIPYTPVKSQNPQVRQQNWDNAPSSPQINPSPFRSTSRQGSFHQQAPNSPRFSESSPTEPFFNSNSAGSEIPLNLGHPHNPQNPHNHPQGNSTRQNAPFYNESNLSRSTQILQKQSHGSLNEVVKKRKICHSCKQAISGQFVRALNNAYHLDCFKCYSCGTQCSSKFFSLDVSAPDGSMIQVPLCEYDYFKKLDLICFSCDTALRGPYITALGNKYHLEHFKCSACGKVFESDESYYEHGNDIYCHFHYSKLFATKCEGCHSSIVKQFVELYKGGKNQQWHPECYMVFKFWNVCFTPEAVGLPKDFPFDSASSSPVEESPATGLLLYEQKIESSVLNCWMILSGFEESTAQCVSEMLLAASTGNLRSGLIVTGKLILYVEVLFNALEFVQAMCLEHPPEKATTSEVSLAIADEVYSADAFHRFQHLRKEPRNISGKIMSYLAILRKSHQIAASGSLSSELLSVITGCAHYLKLLIRIGLNNALKLNILRSDTKAFDTFLQLINKYDEIETMDKFAGEARVSISSRLSIPYNATDACRACSKSIEKSCIRFADSRWHPKCFECSYCHRKPSAELKLEQFLCGPDDLIICPECSKSNSNKGIGYSSGFVTVTDLAQLSYLLRIAILRSKAAIKKELAETQKNVPPTNQMQNISEEMAGTEQDYSKTLGEITALRTKRESQGLRNSVKRKARKSVILESPTGTIARSDNTAALNERHRAESSGSVASYIPLPVDSDQTDFQLGNLKIREESELRHASNSLDRTTDLLKNEKSLTLDDIPRIVAAEQAREQRPNAFKHHNLLYQKRQLLLHTPSGVQKRVPSGSLSQTANEPQSFVADPESKYYSELTKCEHFVLRHIAVEALLQTCDQFPREELMSLVQTKKQSNFWDKFKFGASDKNGKGMHVFGVELSEVSKRYGVDTELGVGPSQLRIPIVIDDIIRALRQKDMSVEGIFRLNGNIKNLRELTDQINSAPLKSPAFDKYSAVQLAALMKKWIRELPNPLLTFNLYEIWIASRKQNDTAKGKRVLQLAYCMLPRFHRNLLEVLLYFFSWVASFAEIDEETGSKMDTHNLATVLAPNILLSRASATENGTNQSSDAHFLAIEVVNQLLEMHEELAVIPRDIWDFYQKLNLGNSQKLEQLSSKEIANKIQKTLQEHPSQFDGSLRVEGTVPSHNNTIKRGQATVHGNEVVTN